jgi:ABC-type antimicrobial peptide transport system permease subunit
LWLLRILSRFEGKRVLRAETAAVPESLNESLQRYAAHGTEFRRAVSQALARTSLPAEVAWEPGSRPGPPALDEIVGAELESRRMQMTLMSAFAGLAVLLAAVGVYGVLSYAVSSRTPEIGVRLALGGDPSHVRSLVVRQGLTLALTGLAIGFAVSFLGATLLERLLFQVSPHDPRPFVLQAAVLLVAGLVAAYLPARRASRVDPVAALRME